jgi:transcriptional regulator with XRE-family HTH domain
VKRTESYREFIGRVESTVEYKVDVAALEFVDELVRAMRLAGVNQAELARRLAASEPYVSKVLRGDTNFTLATMVKLATAVESDIRVHLAPIGSTVYWYDLITSPQAVTDWPQLGETSLYPCSNVNQAIGEGDAETLAAA